MATGWRSSYYRYKELFLNVTELYKKRADLRAFLEIVLSIVAVIIFLLFALKPTALTIISLVQQIKEERVVLAALTQKVNDLQKANTLLIQNQRFLTDIDLAVSTSPNPDVFAKQIEGIAAKDGVSLVGITMDSIVLVGKSKTAATSADVTPLPGSTYEMPYSISIKGSYTNIDNFLKSLENLRVISRIDSMSVTSSVSDAGRVIVAVISGRIPYIGSN